MNKQKLIQSYILRDITNALLGRGKELDSSKNLIKDLKVADEDLYYYILELIEKFRIQHSEVLYSKVYSADDIVSLLTSLPESQQLDDAAMADVYDFIEVFHGTMQCFLYPSIRIGYSSETCLPLNWKNARKLMDNFFSAFQISREKYNHEDYFGKQRPFWKLLRYPIPLYQKFDEFCPLRLAMLADAVRKGKWENPQ